MAQYWGDFDAGTPLTLDVVVNSDATTPIQYQWFKNGVAIEGAVNSVYNFTAQPEDSYASFTVFVQNPCGSELSEPVLLGEVSDQPFCKVYECDAYDSALRALNPDAYFPFTDGISETNGNDNNGGIVFDQVGTSDLTITGNYLNVNAPTILADTCSGTSYFLGSGDVSGVLRAYPHSMGSQSGNGIIAITCDFTISIASAGITAQWARTGSASSTTYISITNSGVGPDTIFGVRTRLLNSGGTQLNNTQHIETIQGLDKKANFQIIWTVAGIHASAVTTWTVYQDWDYNNPLFTHSQQGVINGPNTDPSYLNLIGRDNGTQFNLVIERAVTESEMGGLVDALAQNQSTYTDPNPNCKAPN